MKKASTHRFGSRRWTAVPMNNRQFLSVPQQGFVERTARRIVERIGFDPGPKFSVQHALPKGRFKTGVPLQAGKLLSVRSHRGGGQVAADGPADHSGVVA